MMDSSIYNLLSWVSDGTSEEAPICIDDHKDRRFFWEYWNRNKEALKASGIRMTKRDGNFYISRPLPDVVDENLSMSRAKESDMEVPRPAGLEYFPYQKAAIEFAINKDSVLIGDDPGLGKTIEVAGIINLNDEINRVLIICPASIRLNWKRELDRWLIRERSIGVVNRSEFPEGADIVIINYDVVHRHHEKLSEVEWDLLVLDEAHYLKSKKARRTKYVFGNKKKGISPIKASKKVFLTGTPMVNRPIELFPLLHALDPKEWKSEWSYAQRYCGAHHNGWGWDFSGSSNLDELQHKLRSTIMIRRKKEEVLDDLPPRRRQVIELPFNEETDAAVRDELSGWKTYEDRIAELKARVVLSRVSDNREDYNAAVEELKQGVSAGFAELSSLREKVALAKVPYVLEHIRDIDDKVVIFAHHKSVVKLLHAGLGDRSVVLVGDTKMEDRQEAVDRFQNDPEVQYFIGSIMAAGVGITLTASSRVVFAELDWVPGVIDQCESRCHRLTQKNSVLIQHLVLEGSLDAYMARVLIDKQAVIDKALDSEYSLEEPVIPVKEHVDLYPKDEVEEVSDEEKEGLLYKLRILASFDQDHAAQLNDIGFNKVDSRIGHSLASQMFLSDKQAAVARKLVKKYSRQLKDVQ